MILEAICNFFTYYSKRKWIFFTPEDYIFPSTIMIYGDKVATIVWSDHSFGFVVKSKEVARSHMNFFDISWKIAER
jgi:hypothetical protein